MSHLFSPLQHHSYSTTFNTSSPPASPLLRNLDSTSSAGKYLAPSFQSSSAFSPSLARLGGQEKYSNSSAYHGASSRQSASSLSRGATADTFASSTSAATTPLRATSQSQENHFQSPPTSSYKHQEQAKTLMQTWFLAVQHHQTSTIKHILHTNPHLKLSLFSAKEPLSNLNALEIAVKARYYDLMEFFVKSGADISGCERVCVQRAGDDHQDGLSGTRTMSSSSGQGRRIWGMIQAWREIYEMRRRVGMDEGDGEEIGGR